MLKLIVAICITMGVELAVAADFFAEVQHTKSATVSKNQVNYGLSGGGETLGYWLYGQSASTGYEEVYAGPKLNLTNWLEVGVAVGEERTAKKDWKQRYAEYARISYGDFSAYGVYESDGVTGPWHKLMANYKISPQLTVGVQNQTGLGTGPRVEYAFNKNISVWAAVLKDNSGPTALLALKAKF